MPGKELRPIIQFADVSAVVPSLPSLASPSNVRLRLRKKTFSWERCQLTLVLQESGGRAPQRAERDSQVWMLGEVARSDWFQFVSFYSDGHRALNRFNGDHEILVPTFRQNSFETVQTTTSNSYRLSDSEEGVEGAWDFLRQKPLQIFNLLSRDRNWRSPEANDPDDTLGMENVGPQSRGRVEAEQTCNLRTTVCE